MSRSLAARRAAALVSLAAAASLAACASKPEPLNIDLRGDARVGHVPRGAFLNANGSPRIAQPAMGEGIYVRVAPRLEEWGTDPRLLVDPNYMAAIFVKESGGDTLALSAVPAIGLAQLTARADSDLRAMVAAPAFAWMAPEVRGWPRDSAVHAGQSRDAIGARLANGTLTSRQEYLLDPVASARAAVFWVKLLQQKWTTDAWPGGYGTFARTTLNGGKPLTDDQLFDLVTVSYDRGYVWTRDVVQRFGGAWVKRLPELGPEGVEAADYLDRVRNYTRLLRSAPFR